MLFDGASENLRLVALPPRHPPPPPPPPSSAPSPPPLSCTRQVAMFLHSGLLKQCDLFTEMTPHMIEMLVMKARATSQQPLSTHSSPCASKHRMGRGLPYSPAPLRGRSDAIFAFVDGLWDFVGFRRG